MKHSAEQVEAIVKILLQDIDREYYSDIPMKIQSKANAEVPGTDITVVDAWVVRIPVHDDQFDKVEPAFIAVFIDDDTEVVAGYIDGSGGRPIPMRAEKDAVTGKYRLKGTTQ